MGRVNYIQTNFTAGEFSPFLDGRVDISKYYNGLRILKDMIPQVEGGAFSRPGTYYVAEVADSTKATMLVEFIFSTEQAYILEFGEKYIRFFKNGGPIELGGSPYEKATPYLEGDLFELQFAQSADVLYIVHPEYAPQKLSRTDHTAWTLTQIDFTWGPFLPDNDTTIQIDPSDVAGSIDLVATDDVFDDDGHVGALWKIKTGYVKITAVTDAKNAVATVIETLPDHLSTTDWAEGAWSDYRGYPCSVTFFELRLCFAGSPYQPSTFWMSQTDDYENMQAGSNDSDALIYTIADRQVNAIRWIASVETFIIGTTSGDFITKTGDDSPVTPSNITVKRKFSFGCAPIVPRIIGDYLFYIQSNLRTIREFAYDYIYSSFVKAETTLLAKHITESGIAQISYQESPNSVLWCVRKDGKMACLTREVDQQVTAWSRIVTDGDFKSVAVIPNGAEDQVWVIVERTIGGTAKKYVEYFKPFDYGTEQEDCFFVDCGASLDSPIDISDATKADPVVITTSAAHGLSNGNIVSIRNVVGMTEINGKKFKVANKTADTFELTDRDDNDIDGTAYNAYVSGGEARKCVVTITSGLDHLEGRTVKVLADGATHPNCVVTAGAITLNGYYGEVHVGLAYKPILQTLRLEGGSATGSSQGLTKRIDHSIVRLYKSLGCKVGTPDHQETIIFRETDTPLSQSPPLFTGDKIVNHKGGYDRNAYVYIEQPDPLPLNVLCIITRLSVQEA